MTIEEAIEILDHPVDYKEYLADGYFTASYMAIEALRFQQSVVMCKDCRHYGPMYTGCEVYICVAGFTWPNKDDYCYNGKRR